MRGSSLVFAVTLTAMAAAATAVRAQQPHAMHAVPVVPGELLARTVTLRSGIGRAHDTVGTQSTQAQAFYDQGLAYLHSYVWIEAARSFNQALRLDPNLAVAHVGLSFAHVELNQPAQARAALQRAQALASSATPHDRQHIVIRALQMTAEADPQNSAALTAYRAGLDRAVMAFPDDAELAIWRGHAASPDPANRGQGSVPASVPHYERALKIAPEADGALHFLAHVHENAGNVDAALTYAGRFAAAASAIPHAQHMQGHVLLRAARVAEAVPWFEKADKLGRDYLAREKLPPEYEWHFEHNLDLLGASYHYLGQRAKAERVLREAFALPTTLFVQVFNKRNWPTHLIARDRFEDALSGARVLIGHPSPLARAVGHLETSRALQSTMKYKEAADAFNAALREARSLPAAANLTGALTAQVQGEFFLRTGQAAKGDPMLREVARRVRAGAAPDERMDGLFTLEAMARTARETGLWELARWLAQEMLAHDAQYAGAHFALALTLEQQGDRPRAREAFARARTGWANADPDLPELAIIKAKLQP